MTANKWLHIGDIIVHDPQILKLVNQILFNQQKGILSAIIHSTCGRTQHFVRFIEAGDDESQPVGANFATGITLENFLQFLNYVEEEIGEKFFETPEANGEGTKEWYRGKPIPPAPEKKISPSLMEDDPKIDDDATPGPYLNPPIAE